MSHQCVRGGNYLVGVRVSERRVILARTVGGSVFVHGGGGRGFVQETALCRTQDEKHDCEICRESDVDDKRQNLRRRYPPCFRG